MTNLTSVGCRDMLGWFTCRRHRPVRRGAEGRRTWARVSSAAAVQAESPGQELHTGSRLPGLVRRWRPPWGARRLQPASGGEAGSRSMVAWRGRCSPVGAGRKASGMFLDPVCGALRDSLPTTPAVWSAQKMRFPGEGSWSTASRSLLAKPTSVSFISQSLDTWRISASERRSFLSFSHSRWSSLALLCPRQWVCWGLLLPDKALGTRGMGVRVGLRALQSWASQQTFSNPRVWGEGYLLAKLNFASS